MNQTTEYPLPVLLAKSLSDTGAVDHAFFTREGGVSEGIYQSLNCGYGSDDDPARVTENRRRAAAALNVDPDCLITAYQTHSAEVATVEAPWARGDSPKADAMVTARPGIALGILTADCAPVLFADSEARVIGACHAGWRGAINGVTDATVAAMEKIGAVRERIEAVVGPCIAQGSYQVGPEFYAEFVTARPGNAGYFMRDKESRYRFDLAGYLLERLENDGVADPQWIGLDNCAERDRLFSYRRSTLAGETDFGRGLSAIVLTE